MSLTSELKDAESPLAVFMKEQFPRVRELSAAFRAERPADGAGLRPPVADGTRVMWGTLNGAIDHRLRYAFSDSRALPDTVLLGIAGAVRAAGPAVGTAIRRAGDDLESVLGELIAAERPASQSRPLLLPAAAEARLARLCYAMTWFEEVYRSGRLWPGTPVGDAGPRFTVADLLAAVPAYAVEDLAAQAEVGDLLIDVKGTIAPSRLGKHEFYQLLGYALLDYDDEYRIEGLGFYLSRFGRLITWPVDEYLALLGSSRSLAGLRNDCARELGMRGNRSSPNWPRPAGSPRPRK